MKSPEELFPFPSFREYQREALSDALSALRSGKNIVLDLPTGIGKSGINIALSREFSSSYYTTPQRELRLQLKEDDVLSKYYHVLEARRDYLCKTTGVNCDECSFYTDPQKSCSDDDITCTYMNELGRACFSKTTVLTMSRLLIAGQKRYKSKLDKRDLLIVDEAQNLEDQTASMHANIRIGPDELPNSVFEPVVDKIDPPKKPNEDAELPVLTHKDIWSKIIDIQSRLNGYIEHYKNTPEKTDEIIQCKMMLKNLEYFFKENNIDRTWVVGIYEIDGVNGIELKPVKVDMFLKSHFWSKGDQIVLSTATVPYRGKEDIWLQQLGLDPDSFEIISYPTPFDPLNRMVHTRYEVGKMSQNQDELWEDAMVTLNHLASENQNLNGLVHTASYKRAQKIIDSSSEYNYLDGNIIIDESGKSKVDDWQKSDKDIFVSPSLMEGVNLDGDKCRWQALFKVPYPHPADPRVRKMLHDDRWYWYNQKAAVKILQSVGRAVRSKDDSADFYVIDGSFEDVRNSVKLPEWFNESIC